MERSPKTIEDLAFAAEADLKADPRLSVTLKWAFWHAWAVGQREMMRDRCWRVRMATPTDEAMAGALEGLVQEAVAYEQACAHVLEMLRQRKAKKQQQALPALVTAKQRSAKAA